MKTIKYCFIISVILHVTALFLLNAKFPKMYSFKQKIPQGSDLLFVSKQEKTNIKRKIKKIEALNPDNFAKQIDEKLSMVSELGKESDEILSIKEQYLYELRQYLNNNKNYPWMSKKLKQEGTVIISFVINNNGTFTNISIEQGTNYEQLNTASLKLITKLNSFKKIPKELKTDQLKITVPLEYKLN